MQRIDFLIHQEVLLDVAASVLADIHRFRCKRNITGATDPTFELYSQVHDAKINILMAKSFDELDKLEEYLHTIKQCVAEADSNSSELRLP